MLGINKEAGFFFFWFYLEAGLMAGWCRGGVLPSLRGIAAGARCSKKWEGWGEEGGQKNHKQSSNTYPLRGCVQIMSHIMGGGVGNVKQRAGHGNVSEQTQRDGSLWVEHSALKYTLWLK